MTSTRTKVILISILALATIVVYAHTATFEFVNFDDNGYVSQNRHVLSGLNKQSIKWAFTTNATANWHPLTWLSLMLDCEFSDNPTGACHLTNVLLHTLNTILLFLLLAWTTGSAWPSALVAALFALHPLHVESVAWVSERKDVLSTAFWLLTMLTYVAYTKHRRPSFYLLALAAFALGLMAKPMLVTLPCVLLLFDYWPLQRIHFYQQSKNGRRQFTIDKPLATRLLLEKTPFFVLTIIASLITFLVQRGAGVMSSAVRLDPSTRLANAFVSYAVYLRKTIWPTDLAAFYPYIVTPLHLQILAALLIITLTFVVLRLAKDRKYLTIGWLWYIGTAVPVIGLVQVGMQKYADRYTYIPLIGIFIIIAWILKDLCAQNRLRQKIIAIACTSVLLVFSALTYHQTGTWRNSINLFSHAIEVTRANFVAHNNLGSALKLAGQPEKAFEHWQKANQINPAHLSSATNLIAELLNKNQYARAAEVAQNYLKYEPKDWQMQKRLADIALEAGQNQNAIAQYFALLETVGDNPDLHYSLGLAYARDGKDQKAIEQYKKAITLDENHFRAYHNLGASLSRLRQGREAIEYFEKALKIKDDYLSAHCNLALILAKQGQWEKAANHYERALEIDPNNPQAAKNLKVIRQNLTTEN